MLPEDVTHLHIDCIPSSKTKESFVFSKPTGFICGFEQAQNQNKALAGQRKKRTKLSHNSEAKMEAMRFKIILALSGKVVRLKQCYNAIFIALPQ